MTEDPLKAFLRRIPKAELHCHLMGTVRKDTFIDMVARAGAPIARAEIDAFYTRGKKPVNVSHVLRYLDANLVKTPEDLYRIAIEYLQDSAAHGVRYTEFFWVPTSTVAAGIAYASAQDALVSAMRDAATQFGIVARVIPSIDRQASPAAATEMVSWVVANRCDEVPGIGLEFEEADRPPELFAEAFAAATRAGLRKTAHAGENGISWQNVETAIDQLGVDRIDHGYSVIDNPEFAARCAELGILFTVIPTNSYYLRTLPADRWATDHPIRQMAALGLRIHPNTDDPTLHLVTQTEAWLMMVRDFDFGIQDLRTFLCNGLDGAWIDESQRVEWRTQWTEAFDRECAQWLPAELPRRPTDLGRADESARDL
jgi:adenosine deaminase